MACVRSALMIVLVTAAATASANLPCDPSALEAKSEPPADTVDENLLFISALTASTACIAITSGTSGIRTSLYNYYTTL